MAQSKSSARARDAHPSTNERLELRLLEERLAHELMDDEERCELRDRVIALRRRPSL